MKRNIIHIDIDAFYASVEEVENENLRGKPVAVGGVSDRSIIATVNYKARRYNLHSAMPIFMAKSLCPDLIIVKSDMKKYRKKSREIFSLIKSYCKNIEKVSIDECYLDISDKKDPVGFAYMLKKKIYENFGLTVSIGLSYNKFLAKLASDWRKPDGFMIISESDMPDILYDLDIKKIKGIGEKSQAKLRNIGINKVEDLIKLDEEFLVDMFGKMGSEIYLRIRGIDNRPVETKRIRKSMGVERTFIDTNDEELLKSYLDNYSKELAADLEKEDRAFKTLTLKMKDSEFKIRTFSKSFLNPIKSYQDIYKHSIEIFEKNYNKKKLRLMGISASNLVDFDIFQLSFKDLY